MSNGTPIGNMIIKVDVDGTNVEKSMTGLQRQLKSTNKSMGAQLSAFDRSEKSAEKYSTIIKGLTSRHKVQGAMVDEAKKKYDEMVATYGENSVKAQKAAQDLNTQIQRYQETGRELDKLTAEFEKFQKAQEIQASNWTKIGNGMDNFGGKLKAYGGRIDAVGGKMTKGITLPALTATTAVGGMVSAFGWGRLKSLDNAQAKLKGLGYTMEDVEKISLDVKEAVTGNTMTMAEGIDVAAGALAAGVKEGKELESYIRRVGNAAVGANRPIGDMAMIFHRVEGSGKLMTQELNSIEAGMPGFSKAMSKHLGVSTEKMRKMVTDGKVSSKDFMKVMDSFAGDMAKEYAKTWDGMVSNTKANVGIIGESFLRGVFQDSKKSLADFIELLKSPEIKRRAEEMGKVAQEQFGKMKDNIVGVVNWYQNLDEGQKTLIKRLGLVAVAGGPVLQLTGKLTSGLGSVFQFTGKVTKAIGVARGAGLVAGLASLGPAAIAGIAVAGLAAVAGGIYLLHKRSKEAKEVNIDLAQSLSDEATELENTAEAFNKLTGKAKISNDELAKLHDLNQRISDSTNPGEIKELQEQYNELAKKSGLSKDELKELFEANDDLIKQSPDVEKTVSRQGNAFVENTDAIGKQVEALRGLSETHLKAEHAKLVEQEAEARKKVTEELKEQDRLNDRINFLVDHQGKSQEEIRDLMNETAIAIADAIPGSEEQNRLKDEFNDLNALSLDNLIEQIEIHQDALTKSEESIELEQKKLDKLEATEQQMMNIKLANVGINEEGEKGLEQLDKSISKNQEELDKLDEKLKKNGELTEEEQARHGELSTTIGLQREVRDEIFKEYGIYKDLNSLIESRLDMADEQSQKKVEEYAAVMDIKNVEGDIVDQVKNKNKEHDKEIKKLEQKKKEEGANKDEINKQIEGLKSKKKLNEWQLELILKELGIWEDIKGTIDLGTESERLKGSAAVLTIAELARQGDQIKGNNKLTDTGIQKEKDRSKEAGRHVTKKVTAKDYGSVGKIDKEATKSKEKLVHLRSRGLGEINKKASSPITKTVNFVASGLSKLKFWAKGTPPSGHPGGHAVLGDGGGSELATLPDGRSFLSASTATLYPNLPKGTHVMPHRKTKQIMRSIPHYADGTSGWESLFSFDNLRTSEFMKLLALNSKSGNTSTTIINKQDTNDKTILKAILDQNAFLKQSNDILTQLLNKDTSLYIDSEKVGKSVSNTVTKQQDTRLKMELAKLGVV